MPLSTLDNFYINTYGPTGLNILTHYYPCNEASGNCIDAVGSLNGTLTSITQGQASILPTSDGETCYACPGGALVSMGAAFNTAFPLSWEGWYKMPANFTGGNSSIVLVAQPTTGNNGGCALSVISGQIRLTNRDGSNTSWSGNLSASTVYHIVLTSDGSSTAANTKVYVDGSTKSQTQFAQPLTPSAAAASILGGYAGGSLATGPNFGEKVGIYNAILTSTQVTANYNAGLNGAPSSANSGFFLFMGM